MSPQLVGSHCRRFRFRVLAQSLVRLRQRRPATARFDGSTTMPRTENSCGGARCTVTAGGRKSSPRSSSTEPVSAPRDAKTCTLPSAGLADSGITSSQTRALLARRLRGRPQKAPGGETTT